MKCARCAAEVPGQAQFCMKCGTPVGAAYTAAGSASAVITRAGARSAGNRWLIPGVVGLALLIAALIFGLKALNLTGKTAGVGNGGRVVDAPGVTGTGGPLLDINARIKPGGPVTDRSGAFTPAPNPVDVIDYLKFLKDIERQRITISKKQLGRLLAMSPEMTTLGAQSAIESGEPETSARESVRKFQQMGNEFTTEWQNLAQLFRSKPAPQSCLQLQGKYYEVLGSTTGAISKAMSAFNKAMGGDAGAALDILTGMRGSGSGSASKSVAEACNSADGELGSVCDKFKIHKDFTIEDDGGGANLLGH